MKDCWICQPWVKNLGLLLARVTVGVIFIMAGWMKLQDMSGFISMMEGWGFPAPALLAWVTALVELVGGLAVLLGIFTRVAALLLAVIMLGAILMVHLGNPEAALFSPMDASTVAIALFAACCGLLGSGGGEWKAWSCKCPMS